MNCRGAVNVLDFVHTCPLVECHMHVSTAYVNCNLRGGQVAVHEEIYPLAFDAEEALLAVSKASPSELNALHEKLIGSFPNTYTLTKSMAEHIVVKRVRPELRLVIFRPTIIGASWQEPVPGWIDQVAGAGALFLSVGMGMITIFPGNPDHVADVVPVDLTVNSALVAIAATMSERDKGLSSLPTPFIVHSGTSHANPLRWGLPTRVVPAFFRENPSTKSPLPPKFRMIEAYPRIILEWFFKYTLPVSLYSAVAKLSCSDRKKAKATKLKKATKRVDKFVKVFKPFADDQWTFMTDSTTTLAVFAGDSAAGVWWLDVTQIDWDKYISNFCAGLKKYVLHEEVECL